MVFHKCKVGGKGGEAMAISPLCTETKNFPTRPTVHWYLHCDAWYVLIDFRFYHTYQNFWWGICSTYADHSLREYKPFLPMALFRILIQGSKSVLGADRSATSSAHTRHHQHHSLQFFRAIQCNMERGGSVSGYAACAYIMCPEIIQKGSDLRTIKEWTWNKIASLHSTVVKKKRKRNTSRGRL